MTDPKAFDQQLAREVDHLAGPEPHVDTARIVASATTPSGGSRLARLFGSVPVAATAAAVVLVILVVIVARPADPDRGVVIGPGTTPIASPSHTATATPIAVSGTWTPPDEATCEESEERPVDDDPDIFLLVTECSGFSITATDPRLIGAGGTRLEVAPDGPPDLPSIWSIANDGGSWQSARSHDHERFVFLGRGGYDGMTAVLNLHDDGSLDGILREPRVEVDAVATDDPTETEPTP